MTDSQSADSTVAIAATGDRRDQLLAAARGLFAAKGYDQTTVSDIVRQAGVAQGTFYLYFDSKEQLPGAFARMGAERFGELVEERTAGVVSLSEAVDRLMEAVYEATDEFAEIFRVILRGLELADFEEWQERTEPARDSLQALIERLQAAGEVDGDADAALAARILRDGLERAARSYALFGDRDYGRDLARVLARGLRP